MNEPTDSASTDKSWETELADLLQELAAVQGELLDVLLAKAKRMAASDAAGMAQLESREQDVQHRLEACHQRRTGLLARAQNEGLPGDSLRSLGSALGVAEEPTIGGRVDEISGNVRLLRHHSFANWVTAQRSVLHLSQLLEIIATGGRGKPTYEKGKSSGAGGALLDQAI